MASPLAIDWTQAKVLRAKGLTYDKIASELGCKASAIASRANREKWQVSLAAVENVMQRHAEVRAGERMGELAEAWVQEMIADVQEATSAIRKIKPGSNLRQLGEREQVMERLVKRGRLMFGLDSEAKTTVQVAFFQSPTKPEAQPIDVQEVKPVEPPDPGNPA